MSLIKVILPSARRLPHKLGSNAHVLILFIGNLIGKGAIFGGRLRATSHTRLRAHDHYTLGTLISGKGGAGPRSLHTTLEGLTEYVNARWM